MHSHAHSHTAGPSDHDHHHHGPVALTSINRALIIGAVLNAGYVAVEFGLGLYYHSLALVADAGHNLGDVAGLLLSLLAFRLARVRNTPTYTYGFRKSTVLASLINAVVLLVTIGGILWESIGRFRHPEPVAGGPVAWVAGLGIAVNTVSALLFFRDKDHDLNTRSAYLHLLSDALVSLGVVVAGIVIRYTGWFWLDPIVGVGLALVILRSTWSLLTDSVRLSLDGVPANIDPAAVLTDLRAVPGVRDVHHVHIWAMSTTENALTAHLVLAPNLTDAQITQLKHNARHRLEHQRISHATLETEGTAGDDCEAEAC